MSEGSPEIVIGCDRMNKVEKDETLQKIHSDIEVYPSAEYFA